MGSDVERRDTILQIAEGPGASDMDRKAQVNGADAAARFDLPVVQGAPMLFVEDQHGPSLAGSDRFWPNVPNDMKKNWTRAILALGCGLLRPKPANWLTANFSFTLAYSLQANSERSTSGNDVTSN